MQERRIGGPICWALVLALACAHASAQEETSAPPPEETTAAPPAEDAPPPPAAAAEAAAEEVPTVTVSVPETPPETPAAEGDPDQLDEIVVTAQRRVESLQQTPVSVAAFSTDKLEVRGINNVLDLGSQVPGMTIEPFPINISTLRIFIRGIGILDSQITQDPAVGVYLDGVYLGRSVGLAFDVADLERIEVLRGPQGTLYGRNTTGGAINLITRRPSNDGFTMEHKLMGGNRGYAAGKTMLNVPVTEDIALKVSALSSHKHGFVENG
jgi:iron complex outermembrane recepter protein